jgi:hypothetical protein
MERQNPTGRTDAQGLMPGGNLNHQVAAYLRPVEILGGPAVNGLAAIGDVIAACVLPAKSQILLNQENRHARRIP